MYLVQPSRGLRSGVVVRSTDRGARWSSGASHTGGEPGLYMTILEYSSVQRTERVSVLGRISWSGGRRIQELL